MSTRTRRFCLFRDHGGEEVAVHDGDDLPVTYATLREAQLDSLDELEEHIRQFKAGEREYDHIVFPEEYAVAVWVDERRHVFTDSGREFGKRD